MVTEDFVPLRPMMERELGLSRERNLDRSESFFSFKEILGDLVID